MSPGRGPHSDLTYDVPAVWDGRFLMPAAAPAPRQRSRHRKIAPIVYDGTEAGPAEDFHGKFQGQR